MQSRTSTFKPFTSKLQVLQELYLAYVLYYVRHVLMGLQIAYRLWSVFPMRVGQPSGMAQDQIKNFGMRNMCLEMPWFDAVEYQIRTRSAVVIPAHLSFPQTRPTQPVACRVAYAARGHDMRQMKALLD